MILCGYSRKELKDYKGIHKNKPEEENKMEWTLGEENVVTIIIGDFKDENLPMMLSNKFKELQQLFQ